MLKAEEISGKLLFEEKQQYPRWVLWIVVASFIVALAGVWLAAAAGDHSNEAWISIAILIPLAVFVMYLIASAQLETVVTSNGLYYKWRPWMGKYRVIERDELEEVDLRRFPFLSRGMGWFPGYGWYHIAQRGDGVQLHLKGGKRFFFSSARPGAFKKALQDILSFNPENRQV